MLETITQRLSKVVKNLRGQARLSEDNIKDAVREVRIALLEADVSLHIVKEFIDHIKQKVEGREVLDSLTPSQAFIGIVRDQLVELMGSEQSGLVTAASPPIVILMAGLQGAGKTTSTAKLALHLKNLKKKVLVASCDVYRPAAQKQLELLASQVGVDYFNAPSQLDPVQISIQARQEALKKFHDVLIIDTAGRTSVDQPMMEEMRSVHQAVNPTETLFVVDSMQGQDAVNVAKSFSEAIDLTGVILTKMDGDSRGGAALSVRKATGKPIKFVGVGEKPDGFEPFYPDRIASRILGMGDVLSLVDEARRTIDSSEGAELVKKIKSGRGFSLTDFKNQMLQMKKMGGIGKIMEKLPSQFAQAPIGAMPDEKSVNRTIGIVDAMTPTERDRPEIIKASRKRRIASGAGVTVQEVNKLLNQVAQMQKMMKTMGKRGGLLQKLMGGKSGFPGGFQ
ncbi:MAG: signal recognition particle protein [Burkholderiales bacterium]